MITASVLNLDSFRIWKDDEDLGIEWLRDRLLGTEETEQMRVGKAFHSALEAITEGEVGFIESNGYRFDFDWRNVELEISPMREIFISKQYGDVLVRGKVDSLTGPLVVDYKTTSQFDPDRLMNGYQWRYYLDMTGADRFRWEVFVMKETDDPKVYLISDFHQLEQRRYPELEADCRKLALEYGKFAVAHLTAVTA